MLFDAETERFVEVNKAAEIQYGYSRDELLSLRRQDLSAEPDATAVPILQAVHDRIAEVPLRLHKKKDGTVFPVELVISSLMHGDTKLYCAVVRDITERKKMEEERLKSHMLESVGILAGGIAHDFNNLLAVIVGNINIAKMRMKPDDKAYQPLTDAELSCKMASDLSHRLITFSTGGEPAKQTMSLSGLLVNVITASLQGSNVSPEFDLPENLYPVAVDEKQMKQVVNNLALNAKESMPDGGIFTVVGKNIVAPHQDTALLKAGKYLMISFRDSGRGIPTEDLAKIFDPYYSTKDTFNEKGMGLGLAVCYSIIKRHDGLITVESKYGKETTFHMYLPAVS